ncbi:MAG: EbhA [Coriobacteriia bacterium]|nr:EbhA [Coriobacteriia bacterium]
MTALAFMGCTNRAHEDAVASFELALAAAEAKNTEFESRIDEAQALLDSDDAPFDENTSVALESLIAEAKEALGAGTTIPAMPDDTADILAVTQSLNELDYSAYENMLAERSQSLKDSIALKQQITNPNEAFIIERLQGIESISGITAATEAQDPNGQLNKQGSYTAAIFFLCDLVDQDSVVRPEDFEDEILDGGTDGGGSIEVFRTIEDAQQRYTVLDTFTGTPFSPGSQYVIGTIVIRTSKLLTASQQTELTEQIRDAFLEVR